MSKKGRLTVTIDQELIDVANAAVARGASESVSGWVNEALAERAARDRRLAALADAIAAYEAEFGEITEADMAAQERADREAAIVVRGRAGSRRRRRPRAR